MTTLSSPRHNASAGRLTKGRNFYQMDPIILHRIQFALTVGFHFIFAPLTIGLAWFIFWMLTKYRKSGDETYRNIARFWTKIFTISFVIGVVTGFPLEFEFGTNWASYARFVGDIFGTPLAIEVIFTFFLESIFIAILVYGWNKVSTKALWFSSLMVAIGSTLSAFWIIVANSWMQTPSGYELIEGRVFLSNLWAAVFNPSTLPRFFHTLDGALMTGAFFVMGISAYLILAKSLRTPHPLPLPKGEMADITIPSPLGERVEGEGDRAKISLKFSLIIAFIASIIQLGLGHIHGIQVAFTQPEKLAAIEGIFETQQRAPVLIFGIPNAAEETIDAVVRIPGLLSLLAFGKLDAEVKGLKDFPKDEWPPLALTFYPFHLMVSFGMLMIAFSALGIFLLWRKRLFTNKMFLKLAVLLMPVPFIANELGWMTAEVGRQPWIVYHLMKTSDAISVSVPAGQILFTIICFSLIYILLFALWIFLIRREILSDYN